MLDVVGRGERIRTSDLTVPNRALYQAEPRPDIALLISGLNKEELQKGSGIIGKQVERVKLEAKNTSPIFQ